MNLTIFLRQLFVCSGPWTNYFLIGIGTGFPTVLVPQLRQANQNITIEQFSWLASLPIYSGIPWVIITSVLVNLIGRKKCYIVVCVSSLVSFIISYWSTNMTHFLIGQIFYGALSSSYFTTYLAILTECSSSTYRGTFLTLKTATCYWGILVANAMGTFFHWQNIVLLALICNIYALVNVIFWRESPLWLANKGKFAECAAAHRWFKGEDEVSEKELNKLLKSQQNRRMLRQSRSVRYLCKTIFSKQFWKPILLDFYLICLYCFSGKLVCTVYALDILKKITSSESTAYYGMLILDAVTVGSMYLGSVLSKFVRRRTMLISFASVGIVVVSFISIYLYLIKLSLIVENINVSLFFLSSYSIAVSCGPIIMSTSIMGELIPLEFRSLSMCVMALTYKVCLGTFVKLSPLYFKYLAMHGTFALFAVLSITFLTYIYLPETKDKTLQEIAVSMKCEDKGAAEENTELNEH